jgi:DNA polymerase-1
MGRPKNIYLIDGNSYVYRAYHAIKGLSNSKGFPTNAIYGFINMLRKILKEKEPEAIVVSFDSPVPTERHRIYEEYKAQRPETPGDLIQQIPYIRRILKALNINIYEVPGYEADDVLATLARGAASQGTDVFIVTGDKDMLQVLDNHIRIYDPMKNRLITKDDVIERFGIPPERIPEIMALTGDPVDNIPGVKGIGEKTACEILRDTTLREVLENPELVKKERMRRLIEENIDMILMSKALSKVDSEVPVELDINDCVLKEPNWDELLEIFRELEFNSLIKEMIPAGMKKGRYEEILDLERLKRIFEGVKEVFSFEIEHSGDNFINADIAGIAFSVRKDEGYYVPVGHHYLGAPAQLSSRDVYGVFRRLFEDESISKAGHNLKSEIMLVNRLGMELRGRLYDTEIASYLLNPNRQNHSLDEVGLEYLNIRKMTLDELLKKRGSFSELSIDEAKEFAGTNTALILELKDLLFRRLREEGLNEVYFNIEMPLLEVLADMELTGIKLDSKILYDISGELVRELTTLQSRIYSIAGEEFNINSPKQLGRVLFQTLGLRPVKKTKTGYSTEVGVLEELAKEHELPGEILNWRSLVKLKNTYVDVLPRLVNKTTGRIHTTFNQTMTATGRLSSSDPNLQNIPIRGEWGMRIREAFTAEKGYVLLSADYSQIELRVLAHLSRDEGLLEAFRSGVDIHTRTAMEIFGVPEEGVTPDMRRVAKTVNFGVVYGISAFGLSEAMGITREDASSYIEQYFEKYSGVKRYTERIIEEAKRLGYVRTLFGRKRAIPELRSSNLQQRNLGIRLAMNTPIQGSAADIIKIAMINIYRRLSSGRFESRMVLQVHDELLFEVKEEELSDIKEIVRYEMENAVSLDLPLKVEVGYGKNWAEAH